MIMFIIFTILEIIQAITLNIYIPKHAATHCSPDPYFTDLVCADSVCGSDYADSGSGAPALRALNIDRSSSTMAVAEPSAVGGASSRFVLQQ